MKLNLIICFAVCYCLEYAIEARVRVRSRTRYSRTNQRNSWSSRNSGVRSSRTRYAGYAAAFAAGYYIAGMSRYNRRFGGTRYYRDDPPICSNINKPVTFDNDTVSDTLKMEYFICPYELTDGEDDIYCCGPEFEEYCCSYWDGSGRTAGAVIGIVILVIVVIVGICCCVKKCQMKQKKPRSEMVVLQQTNTSVPPVQQHLMNPSTNDPPPYPIAPSQPLISQPPYPAAQPSSYPRAASAPTEPYSAGPIGFEAVAPPSYEQSTTGYPSKG